MYYTVAGWIGCLVESLCPVMIGIIIINTAIVRANLGTSSATREAILIPIE
jgi:hypothetical protein